MAAAVVLALLPCGPDAPRRRPTSSRYRRSKTTSIKIAKGKPKTIKTNVPFYEIVIGDPEIANVNPLTDSSFYVLGNKLGTTGIALFDENKQLVGSVDIEVTLDTDKLASTIRDSVPGTDIDVKSANGRLVLSGSAEDSVAADKATQHRHRILRRREGHQLGQHLVLAAGPAQRPLRRGQPPGRRWSSAPRSPRPIPGRTATSDLQLRRRAHPRRPRSAGCFGSLLSGGFSIDVLIKALEDRGVARRLAEPNLIARSGESASFLAGGEFPIPVSEDDGEMTRHLQEVRRQPRLHADRAAGRTDQPRDRAGGFVDRPGLELPGRQHLDPRLHRAPRPYLGRPEERPELHDRRACCRARTTRPRSAFPAWAGCRSSARCSAPRPTSAARPIW